MEIRMSAGRDSSPEAEIKRWDRAIDDMRMVIAKLRRDQKKIETRIVENREAIQRIERERSLVLIPARLGDDSPAERELGRLSALRSNVEFTLRTDEEIKSRIAEMLPSYERQLEGAIRQREVEVLLDRLQKIDQDGLDAQLECAAGQLVAICTALAKRDAAVIAALKEFGAEHRVIIAVGSAAEARARALAVEFDGIIPLAWNRQYLDVLLKVNRESRFKNPVASIVKSSDLMGVVAA
jgi:hypothetical protein